MKDAPHPSEILYRRNKEMETLYLAIAKEMSIGVALVMTGRVRLRKGQYFRQHVFKTGSGSVPDSRLWIVLGGMPAIVASRSRLRPRRFRTALREGPSDGAGLAAG